MQTGLHILGELYSKETAALTDICLVKDKISVAISDAGLHQVGFAEHSFDGGGYTLVALLAESHVSLHTWPEYQYATLDVFVCNVTKDNSERAATLFNAIANLFSPTKLEQQSIIR